ncbi:hypothetical protein [Kutzneria albida]|uniref:Secreted protein n=1 Tax=Kutzneria albida DSM 43870 TaxID=1449976 RepID=W5WLI7_9PSEU|nr:hypothetical protein [Kutzneria albida]AHI02089.1 hypothetical protein KALB_8732 [Kutzneria albida DSM 43870]
MRKTVLATTAVAAALTVGACGSPQQGTPSAAQPNGGLDKTGSSLFGDANQLVLAAKAGTSKAKSSKFTMESAVGGESVKASGAGRYDGANTAMSMSMDAQGQQIEMVLADKTIFIKLPDAQRAMLGSDKAWVKLGGDGNDPLSKALGGSMSKSAEQSDPTKTLEQISQAGKITKSEQTTLDGKQASHYSVDVDFAKLAGQSLDSLPAEAKTKLAGKNVHFPVDLWLDGDQLPIQIKMDMTEMMTAMGAPAKATAGGAVTTMHYSDWGTAVDVKAPPADQVADLSAMMGKLGR